MSSPVPEVSIERLPALQMPLLNKFYKQHRSRMRGSDEHAWVARRQHIVAALKLSPVAQGHWLTGLFTDPAQRAQGVASRLVKSVLEAYPGPVWLFCEPALTDFYLRLGFVRCQSLPEPLGDRLQRYQHSRRLLALVYPANTAP
jgi:GNAT superfamily N-acetyltransferase